MRIKIFTAKGEEMKKEPNNLKTVWSVILRVKNIFAYKLPKGNEVDFGFSDIQRAFKVFVDDKSFFRARIFFFKYLPKTYFFFFFFFLWEEDSTTPPHDKPHNTKKKKKKTPPLCVVVFKKKNPPRKKLL